MAITWKKLAYTDEVVLLDGSQALTADWNAGSFRITSDEIKAGTTLYAGENLKIVDKTGVTESDITAVPTGGNIGIVVKDNTGVETSAAYFTSGAQALYYEGNVKLYTNANGIDIKDKAIFKTDSNIYIGADASGNIIFKDLVQTTEVTLSQLMTNVGLHASTHKNGGSDEILLHELGEPTSSVNFDGQQLQDAVIHTVADETAMLALTAVVGKMVFRSDTLAMYICTSSS